MDAPSLSDQKQALRDILRTRREAVGATEAAEAAMGLRDQFLCVLRPQPFLCISSYIPVRGEMDPRPLCAALQKAGHRLSLPVMQGKGMPLLFRLVPPDERLIQNAYGLWEPPDSAPCVDPDLLLVPLLAFDRALNRLGSRGGYYDRTLPALRAQKPVTAIGLAYSFQEVPSVPIAAHDQPLDGVVTETEAIVS